MRFLVGVAIYGALSFSALAFFCLWAQCKAAQKQFRASGSAESRRATYRLSDRSVTRGCGGVPSLQKQPDGAQAGVAPGPLARFQLCQHLHSTNPRRYCLGGMRRMISGRDL